MSEKKQILIDLLDNERGLQLLAHFSFEGILIYNKGKTIEVNDEMLRMTGLNRESILSGAIPDACIPNLHDRKSYLEAVSDPRSPFEMELKRADGQLFTAEVESRAFTYKKASIIVVAVRDISSNRWKWTRRSKR